MTILKLYGIFSYIDRYNKLHFAWLDDDLASKHKVTEHCPSLPTGQYFTVTLPKYMKRVQPDIREKVGSVCTIYVKVTPYDFISKLEHNFGDRVTGHQLVLNEIKVGCR